LRGKNVSEFCVMLKKKSRGGAGQLNGLAASFYRLRLFLQGERSFFYA